MLNANRTQWPPSRRALPVMHQTRAAAAQSARETGLATRETAPSPPKSAADDMDEEDRPKPTEGPDNLKVSDDVPSTPSESDPALPNPSKVVPKNRDEETEATELGHGEEQLSADDDFSAGNDVWDNGF